MLINYNLIREMMKQKILKSIRKRYDLKKCELNMVKFFGSWYFTGKAATFLKRTPIDLPSLDSICVEKWNQKFDEIVSSSNLEQTSLREKIDSVCWIRIQHFILNRGLLSKLDPYNGSQLTQTAF